MTHDLSKENKLLKSSIAKIAKEKISALAEETDREAKFPWHTVKLLKQYDMFAVDFPEKYEGADMGLFSVCLIVPVTTTFSRNSDLSLVNIWRVSMRYSCSSSVSIASEMIFPFWSHAAGMTIPFMLAIGF